MADESDKFYVCRESHHMVIQRTKQKEKIAGHTFYRMCKFCGALEMRQVTQQKDQQGNVMPKVIVYIAVAGRTVRLPSRLYRQVDSDEGAPT